MRKGAHPRAIDPRVGPTTTVAMALLMVVVACSRDDAIAPSAPPEPSHPPQCRAGILLPGSDLVGDVSRIPANDALPVRLVDVPFVVDASKVRERPSPIERVGRHVIRTWTEADTSLGARRISKPFRTPLEHAEVLVLKVARGVVDEIDVTVVPVGEEPTPVERLQRTVRLDFSTAATGVEELEIALQPLLRGNWRHGPGHSVGRFRIEIDAKLPLDALLEIEVRPRSARFEGPAAKRTDGPPGTLRPGFHLRSGASVRLPIGPSTEARELVFYTYAALGRPRVAVRLSDRRAPHEWMSSARRSWSRHEVEIAPTAGQELVFEVRGNGVVLIGDPTLWSSPPKLRPPDVIVYLIDTLLASRLGALGSDLPDVSPAMDELIGNGLAFVRATSTSSWTKPAVASLLTGVYPLTHRVGTRNYTDRLPHGVPMLQTRFRQAGFRTLSASASPLGSTLSGLERGFDLAQPPAHWSNDLGPLGHPSARQLQAAVLEFIEEDPSRPIFAYLHTLEVHEFWRPMFADGKEGEAPYDRAIRHQDQALRELLAEYRRLGRELVLVLVSDHGEGFGEYGVTPGHGYSVRQNQLHVPLVFYGPRWLPRGRVAEPASLVDVAPTLLDLFSLSPLPYAQGRSLLPGPNADPPPAAVYAERTWFLWDPDGPELLARVGVDGRKSVAGYDVPVTWDLAKSPCEDAAHRLDPSPQETSELRRFLSEQRDAAKNWDGAYGASEPGRIDPGDIARLRALGYLE